MTREEETPQSVSTWSLDFITGQTKGFNDGIRVGKTIAIKMLEEFISDKMKMINYIGHADEFINDFKKAMKE